jgi:hypothetical protein
MLAGDDRTAGAVDRSSTPRLVAVHPARAKRVRASCRIFKRDLNRRKRVKARSRDSEPSGEAPSPHPLPAQRGEGVHAR